MDRRWTLITVVALLTFAAKYYCHVPDAPADTTDDTKVVDVVVEPQEETSPDCGSGSPAPAAKPKAIAYKPDFPCPQCAVLDARKDELAVDYEWQTVKRNKFKSWPVLQVEKNGKWYYWYGSDVDAFNAWYAKEQP